MEVAAGDASKCQDRDQPETFYQPRKRRIPSMSISL